MLTNPEPGVRPVIAVVLLLYGAAGLRSLVGPHLDPSTARQTASAVDELVRGSALLILLGLPAVGRSIASIRGGLLILTIHAARVALSTTVGISLIWGFRWFDRLDLASWLRPSGLTLVALGVGILADECVRRAVLVGLSGHRPWVGVIVAAGYGGLRGWTLPMEAWLTLTLIDGVLLSECCRRGWIGVWGIWIGSLALAVLDVGLGLWGGWWSTLP